jgi:4-hydroxybenzoate polyprenyltransferase
MTVQRVRTDLQPKASDVDAAPVNTAAPRSSALSGYVQIARIDHWVKNVFVLPGVVVALSVDRARLASWSWVSFVLGMLAVCLIASSNYVLNEILDAPSDLAHPTKRNRPVPAGRVNVGWAYVEWIALMAAGLGLGLYFEGLCADAACALGHGVHL